MNSKHLTTFTTIVLATGLSQLVMPAHAKETTLNSTFNAVVTQRSPKNSSSQTELVLFHHGRESNVLLSQKKNPPPPRPSPPGGGRLTALEFTHSSLNLDPP
jgi:hypothetical protein